MSESNKLSKIKMAEPSPKTKPSRFLSKGRLAFVGLSFKVERARIFPKPDMAKGQTQLSVPPAIMTSA